jgi:hypothetical protein
MNVKKRMKFLLSKMELSEGAFERECGLSKGLLAI